MNKIFNGALSCFDEDLVLFKKILFFAHLAQDTHSQIKFERSDFKVTTLLGIKKLFLVKC